jgi:hypothetical protein
MAGFSPYLHASTLLNIRTNIQQQEEQQTSLSSVGSTDHFMRREFRRAPRRTVKPWLVGKQEIENSAQWLLRRKRFSKGFDVLCETSFSSVDHNMLAVPRMILARDYLLPTWQLHSENVCFACFYSGAMLTRIGTYDFDFHSDHLSASTNFEPRIARDLQWIDRIGNYCPPDAKVIFGDRIGDPISCLVKPYGVRGAISDRLLNRVNP